MCIFTYRFFTIGCVCTNKFLEKWNNIGSVAIGNRDPYDLTQDSSASFPPEYYLNYLSEPSVVSAIGAQSTYTECADPPYNKFVTTGDVNRSDDFCRSRAHRAFVGCKDFLAPIGDAG